MLAIFTDNARDVPVAENKCGRGQNAILSPMASEKLAAVKSDEICHRCLRPVLVRTARCPNCGVRLHRVWHVAVPLEILGLLALVFVAALIIKAIRDQDIENAPPQGQGQEQPAPGTN